MMNFIIRAIVPAVIVFLALVSYDSIGRNEKLADKDKPTTLFGWVVLFFKRTFGNSTQGGRIRALAIGCTIGAINYLNPMLYAWHAAWISVVFFIVMIGLFIYILRLSADEKDGIGAIKDIIPLLAVMIIFYLTMMSVVWMMSTLWDNRFLTGLVTVLPKIMLIFAIFFFIIVLILFLGSINKKEKVAKGAASVAGLIGAIAIIAMLVSLPWASLKTVEAADDLKVSAEDLETAQNDLTVNKLTVEELEQLTLGKYANISQVFLDSSLTPQDKARTESTGFSDALTFGFTSEDDAGKFLEVQEELLRNPVYGVTVAKALSTKKLGDKTIAELNPWMTEFIQKNDSGVSYWLEYRGDDKETIYVTDEYRQYAATICVFLERLVNQGVHAYPTCENWRLNDTVKNNDRAGILAEYQYTKDALILSYITKAQAGNGEMVSVSLFTIGFNIHDKRPEFYDKTPTPTPIPPTPEPTSEPTPTPDITPEPTPEPTPTPPPYNKDPEKAPKENTEPNDDPGPGPDTNNGVGATESPMDLPTNSNHEESYSDYQEDLSELEKVNNSQQVGGDPNTPSTPKPTSETNVDNNADEGTGNGGIDEPTEITEPAHEAETGNPINTSPAGQWDGPPD
ncbi:hypothetical protein IKD49_02585 [Candidatus Saccharibacteria bacterium]|nr:hypothetical protein [Candidatus Saccharibacteria bacterium]